MLTFENLLQDSFQFSFKNIFFLVNKKNVNSLNLMVV